MKYFLLQVGEKPNWSWNLIDYPQPTSHVCWNPNCPLVKRKKKNDVHEQINILPIPNSSMHILTLALHLCQGRGSHRPLTHTPVWLVLLPASPSSSGGLCTLGFPAQPVDCSLPHLSWGRCWRPQVAAWRGDRPRSAAGLGSPGVRQTFWQVRN